MTEECAKQRSAQRVPDLECVIRTGGDDPGAVWADRALVHGVGMTRERAEQGSGLRLPHEHLSLMVTREDVGAVRAHRAAQNRPEPVGQRLYQGRSLTELGSYAQLRFP